ncbi:MAG: CPCC family cysteine-rich protein [Nitrososphaerales archaeon]
MNFDDKVDAALDGINNTKCPSCGASIMVISGKPHKCDVCGWQHDATPTNTPYLQFGQRFSELARMRSLRNVSGINAGRVS